MEKCSHSIPLFNLRGKVEKGKKVDLMNDWMENKDKCLNLVMHFIPSFDLTLGKSSKKATDMLRSG